MLEGALYSQQLGAAILALDRRPKTGHGVDGAVFAGAIR
jgi:hypothetical protein